MTTPLRLSRPAIRANTRHFSQSVSIALLVVICSATKAVGQIQRVEQWGLQEISLQSNLAHANPFTDVDVRGRFRSGSRTVEVYGFYDGNHTWKVRFMPEQQGEWSYTTLSNDAQLSGKSGRFLVGPRGNNHGPVKVTNTYHFAYADGTPYFPLGTTLYNWLNRDRDLEGRTLNTLEKGPFNKVRFLVFPKWMAFNHVEPPRFPYVKATDGRFDLDRFDPEFFAHYEARLKDLQALGIEAATSGGRWQMSSMYFVHRKIGKNSESCSQPLTPTATCAGFTIVACVSMTIRKPG